MRDNYIARIDYATGKGVWMTAKPLNGQSNGIAIVATYASVLTYNGTAVVSIDASGPDYGVDTVVPSTLNPVTGGILVNPASATYVLDIIGGCRIASFFQGSGTSAANYTLPYCSTSSGAVGLHLSSRAAALP